MKKILYIVLIATMFLGMVNLSAAENSAKAQENVKKEHYSKEYKSVSIGQLFKNFYKTTGIYAFLNPKEGATNALGEPLSKFAQSWGRIIMILITFLLFYLAIAKGFEPLLLLPIAFGGLLANIPLANIIGHEGFIGTLFDAGIKNELFPLIIFMGVGALTDFGPLLANPKTALLGAAAQFGIFGSLLGALLLSQYTPFFDFTLKDASAISIIGGADGPTSIFVASKLSPDLMGAIAVAAYSYMALVPIIQPPIMRLFTTKEERKIKMKQLREVSKLEKILFPLTVLVLSILILPESTPLIGALTFGNFAKVSGVVDRLSNTMQNALINIVTIFLGLGVGSKLAAEKFLVADTLGILAIGLFAFAIGTMAGVLMAKVMNKFSKDPINPLIGSAGVSAVPMAARVSNKVGMEEDKTNMLLMHAMGPNVAGVIGSAVAAGVLLSIFK
jgi:oxaloacetate decarboxylase beta subunit